MSSWEIRELCNTSFLSTSCSGYSVGHEGNGPKLTSGRSAFFVCLMRGDESRASYQRIVRRAVWKRMEYLTKSTSNRGKGKSQVDDFSTKRSALSFPLLSKPVLPLELERSRFYLVILFVVVLSKVQALLTWPNPPMKAEWMMKSLGNDVDVILRN